MILVNLLEDMGHLVFKAENGQEAIDIVEKEAMKIDVIVLDKAMPVMDGIGVVEELKHIPQALNIPIVMVTGSTEPDEVKEGIDAGVFYYLTKPYAEDVFLSVITSALKESERRGLIQNEIEKQQTGFKYINDANFTIKRIDEAEDLARFLANCFPNPAKAYLGLYNLLLNAIEHGNLEVGYDDKTMLMTNNSWEEEINFRQESPKYEDRVVRVAIQRTDEKVNVQITDEGKGFNWSNYMDIDPSRALDIHGRGIAQANKVCFDTVEYNDEGNSVTVTSQIQPTLKW
tara:strand:- start:926 stop:1786 length:861 start_codon:yes stop_codon:yes gene_type:complete